MIKKFLNIFIILIAISFQAIAQNITSDSLNEILSKKNLKSNPKESLNIISKIYNETYLKQPYTAIENIGLALYITDSILHDSTQSAKWLQKLGKVYLYLDKYDLAMKYIVKSKNYYEKTKDSIELANSYFYLGEIYKALNVKEIAQRQFNKSLKIFQNFDDTLGIVKVNIEKAKILYDNYKTKLAHLILQKTLPLTSKNDSLSALVCKTQGELYTFDENTDSAEYFLNLSVKKFSSINDNIQKANSFLELGNLYVYTGNYTKAKKYYTKALETFTQNKYTSKIIECYNDLGILYFQQNNFKQSENYFNKALALIQTTYSSGELIAYKYLAKISQQKNDYKKSTFYLNQYIDALKKTFQSKAEQGYAEVILTFQNEENQKEIELLEKEDALKSQLLRNKQQQVYGAAIVIILLIFFAIILYFYIRKQKKINLVLQEQNRKINLQKKEIETQSRILEKATRDLLKQKDKIVAQNNKIKSSITYASRIQKAMLPDLTIFNKFFEDSFVLFMPKETVSGDFYWISQIKEQKPSLFKSTEENTKIVVTVVDCTGHGVPGAFMSMLGDAYLNQIINVLHITEPDKILYELHKTIRFTLQQEHSENNDGMDLALCVIDKKERTLKFAGAKNPLVYIQNGKINRIQGDLMSIGGLQKEKERLFKVHTIDITAKTWIYLYSDGYQDQFGGKYGRKFMAQPFRQLLLDNHKRPFEEQKQVLISTLNSWKGKKYHQMDDITVLGLLI
jgi:serine phosphatase RsbU (regulator of sigma subunit)